MKKGIDLVRLNNVQENEQRGHGATAKQRKTTKMNEIAKESGQKIASLIMAGIEAWLEAGKLLVEALDNGATLDDIVDSAGVSKDILARFEQIGRNNLYPRLLASTSPGARALTGCPFSEQKHYCHNPVKLLVMHDGQPDTLLVPLDNMTTDQVKQVFCRGHIRDVAEQRAYLESKMESERMQAVYEVEDGAGYVLKGRTVLFKRGICLNKDDLIQILGRMK